MRGKKLIRCNDCGVDSDKKIILVYHGSQKCQNCAAMEAMESRAAMKIPVGINRDLANLHVSKDGAKPLEVDMNIPDGD